MNDQVIYGVILIVYVIPYVIWSIARDQKVEMLKEFYPGRANENAIERRGHEIGGVWALGLVILLIGWKMDWHPVMALIIVAFIWVLLGIIRKTGRLNGLLKLRRTRGAIATAIVWFSVVFGWYVVFGDRYGFEVYDALLLSFVPIPIAGIAFIAYHWVQKGQS